MWYFLSLLGKKYWMVLFYYLKYKFWLIQLCTCSFYQFFVLFSLKFLVHYRSALLVQSIFLDLGGFSSKSKPSFSGIRQVRFATRKNWTKWVRSSVEVLLFAFSLSEVECRGLKTRWNKDFSRKVRVKPRVRSSFWLYFKIKIRIFECDRFLISVSKAKC